MDSARVSSYRFVIEGSILLLQFALGLSFLSVAPLFPLIIDTYGVDRATASLLVGGSSLVLALAFIPCSLLPAKLGMRNALALGGLLMGTGMLAPLAYSFPLLLATRLIFAIGAAIAITSASGIIMGWFPPRELPLVNGLNVIGQSLGVTASMFLSVLIADWIGWQGALFCFGAVDLLATTLWFIVGREEKSEVTSAGLSLEEIKAALGQRTTLLLGIGVAGGVAQFVTFSSWLPSYYHDEFGFSLQKAGNIAGLLSLLGIAGSLLGSVLPFQVGLRRPFLIIPGLFMPLIGLGCFLTDTSVILYPSVGLLGILGWLYFPVMFTIPMELPNMTPRRVGMTVAIVLGMGNLTGFFAPLLVGFLRDQTGSFWLGLLICSLAPLSLLVVGYLLPETGPNAKAKLTSSKVAQPAP